MTVSSILWVLLAVTVIAEIFTVQGFLSQMLHALNGDPGARQVKTVVVNTDAYQKAVERITGSESYEPSGRPSSDPFFVPKIVK